MTTPTRPQMRSVLLGLSFNASLKTSSASCSRSVLCNRLARERDVEGSGFNDRDLGGREDIERARVR